MSLSYWGLRSCTGLLLALSVSGLVVFHHFGQNLPDHLELANYEPQVVTRVHAGDGHLLAEHAFEHRMFVPIGVVPKRVIDAFLSAEDKYFRLHPGINPLSIVRSFFTNIRNALEGRRLIGASTITQQVAKNFLLSNEVSAKRKIREAILALRMERVLSKDRILELYLNQIYLGASSYGVAAAGINYFDKSLGAITLAEAAFLASLPKAPSNYHPERYPQEAEARRNWVLQRMLKDGRISSTQYTHAIAEPLIARVARPVASIDAPYFAEHVRRFLVSLYGNERVYGGGLSVRTSLQPRLQDIAGKSLRAGLVSYDKRHGWRGPVAHMQPEAISAQRLGRLIDHSIPVGIDEWELAVVVDVAQTHARVLFREDGFGRIELADLEWARTRKKTGLGPKVTTVAHVLSVGDVVWVEKKSEENTSESSTSARHAPQTEKTNASQAENPPVYLLRQVPRINGALVALDPHTGRVLATTGGFSFAASKFNRATQARRQPGSAFKPIVYMAALDSGYTPLTVILDAPVVVDQGPYQESWRPSNYERKFYGPSLMRVGVEQSRNLMTVRLAQEIGMEKVTEYARRFGVADRMQPFLSMSLGAGETTLLRLTAAYGMIVNGGKYIVPSFVDRIQDRNGHTIYRHDTRDCPACLASSWQGQRIPRLADDRVQIVSPQTAYQMVSMLEGVVQRGTGARLRSLQRPLAGKTGTTKNGRDAWFLGFTPDLVVGVYTGFDLPQSLGRRETGASVALPIFERFIQEALQSEPIVPFRVPPGIRLVRIDSRTGRPPHEAASSHVYLEALQEGSVTPVHLADKTHMREYDRVGDDSRENAVEGLY